MSEDEDDEEEEEEDESELELLPLRRAGCAWASAGLAFSTDKRRRQHIKVNRMLCLHDRT